MRQVSTFRSTFKAKAESYKLCREKQQADYDASMICSRFLTAVKSNRTSLQEGKSDSERVGSRGVVRADSAGTSGYVVGRHGRKLQYEGHAVDVREP